MNNDIIEKALKIALHCNLYVESILSNTFFVDETQPYIAPGAQSEEYSYCQKAHALWHHTRVL